MKLTRSALSMLTKKYKAVLKKCLRNKLASSIIAAATIFALNGAAAAAGEYDINSGETISISSGSIDDANGTIEKNGKFIQEKDGFIQINNSTMKNNGEIEVNGNIDILDNSKVVNNGNISVNSYGTLFWSDSSLENNGDIKVAGKVDFAQNQGNNISIKNTGTIQIAATYVPGQNVYSYYDGVWLGSLEQFNNVLEGKLVLGHIEEANDMMGSMLNITSNETLKLNTSDFISGSTPQAGKILMGRAGVLFLNRTRLQLQGNSLKLGSNTFDPMLTNGVQLIQRASICTDFLTLSPNTGNTFALESGRILINGRSENPYIKIGDNNGILHINGGIVGLGQSTAGTQGGQILGNIIIGNEALNEYHATNTIDNVKHYYDSFLDIGSGDWTIKGDVTLEKSGRLRVGGHDDINTGELLTANLYIDGVLTLNGYNYSASVLRDLSSKSLIANENITLNVGDESTYGVLTAGNIEMRGGMINFDPPFSAAGDISNASLGGLEFKSGTIDARINIGQNSLVSLGSQDPEWLRSQIANFQSNSKLLWGRDITAALAIRSPQTLASIGGINVDGTWTNGGDPAQANTVRFADKSLFVIDAAGVNGKAALSGNGEADLKVESGAKLLITDAAIGDKVIITDRFANSEISEKGWSENLSSSTDLQLAEGELVNPSTGEYVVRIINGKTPATVFPALSSELGTVLDNARQTGLDANSSEAGVRFISRAVDNRYIGATDTLLASLTMESAARMAVVGAVPQMTKAANEAAGAAITQRTGLAQPDGILQGIDQNGELIQDSGIHANSFALWIMPLYQSTNGFGMEAGNFSYDFNGSLGGVALGADYTFENMLRLGLSFNIGGGYAQGSGDLNKTTNNMNFWGIGAYAGWNKNNFALSADVNYTTTYNKLKQELPEQMQMSDLKGDLTAWALSTGLRAEYKITTDILDIVPHVGFRFTYLNVDSYDFKSNDTVINGDSWSQNIWTFPIGVSLKRDIELNNGWKMAPLLDLNITPSAGDFNSKSKIHFTGIGQEAELETKIMDYVTYGGTAGIEFKNDSVSFGINYNGQFGATSSAHGVFGTFRYEF